MLSKKFLTFFFEISHRRACRIRSGGSDPFDLLSNINIRSFNIWGLLKSSAKTDPSTTDLGKHVEHFCVKFQRRKSVPVWCSVQNIHCNRLLTCRYAELWTLLWYDWSHHWCVLHLWVSSKGQLISEWLFDVLNFPKNQRKNLMNFCPGHFFFF